MRGAGTFAKLVHAALPGGLSTGHHPLRPIRQMVNEALVKMEALFAPMYEAHSKGRQPSIAFSKLLRGLLSTLFRAICVFW